MAKPKLKLQTSCRADTANLLKKAVAKYYTKKRFAVFFELGLNRRGRLRADVFAFSFKQEVVVIEVKSSLADFRTDKKFQDYHEYCNKLYIATTVEVAAKIKDTLPPKVGLFVIDGTKLVCKKPARSVELCPTILENLTTRMIFRNADNCNRRNATKNLKVQDADQE